MPLNEDILHLVIPLASHTLLLELCLLSRAVYADVVRIIYHTVELRSYNKVAQFLRTIKVDSPRSQRLINATQYFVECVDPLSFPPSHTGLIHGAIAAILKRLTNVLGVKLAIVDSKGQPQPQTGHGMRSVYSALCSCTRLRHLSLRGLTVAGLQQLVTDLTTARSLASLDLRFAQSINATRSIMLVGRLCTSVRALTLSEEFLQLFFIFCQAMAVSGQEVYRFPSLRYLCCPDRHPRVVLPRQIAEVFPNAVSLRTRFIDDLQPTDFPNLLRLDMTSLSDARHNFLGERRLAWLVLAEFNQASLPSERPASHLEKFASPYLRVLRVELDLNLDAGAMLQLVGRLFPAIHSLDVCVRAHKTTDLRSFFRSSAPSTSPILPNLASLTLRWTSPSRSANAQIVASSDLDGFAKQYVFLDVIRICQRLDHDGGTGSGFWGYMSWRVRRGPGVIAAACAREPGVCAQEIPWPKACDIARSHLPYTEQELGGAPWDVYDV